MDFNLNGHRNWGVQAHFIKLVIVKKKRKVYGNLQIVSSSSYKKLLYLLLILNFIKIQAQQVLNIYL